MKASFGFSQSMAAWATTQGAKVRGFHPRMPLPKPSFLPFRNVLTDLTLHLKPVNHTATDRIKKKNAAK